MFKKTVHVFTAAAAVAFVAGSGLAFAHGQAGATAAPDNWRLLRLAPKASICRRRTTRWTRVTTESCQRKKPWLPCRT